MTVVKDKQSIAPPRMPSIDVIMQTKSMLVADIAALDVTIGLLTKQRSEKRALLEKWEKSSD